MKKIAFLPKLLTVAACFMVLESCTKMTEVPEDKPLLAITEEMDCPEYVDGVAVWYQDRFLGYCIAEEGRTCYLFFNETDYVIGDGGYAYKP